VRSYRDGAITTGGHYSVRSMDNKRYHQHKHYKLGHPGGVLTVNSGTADEQVTITRDLYGRHYNFH